MSIKNSHTTADYIPWDSAINVIHRLYREGSYRMSLYVAVGIFTGLRVTDLRSLRWANLMGDDTITVIEHKTRKRRNIRLNHELQNHVRDCYSALKVKNSNELCFLSQKRVVFSIQRLNIMLKDIKKKYRLPVKNMSNHSLRKTFGRKIFDEAGDNKEMALIKLSEIFGHSNTQITRRYLGLKNEEILEAYDLLCF